MRLSYKLDDPGHQIEFNRFFDTPLKTGVSKKQVVTPAQLLERRVHQLSREITASYGGRLVVQTSIIRGSFGVIFDLIGNTFDVLKDYKELVEIVMILSSQTQAIVNRVNKTQYLRQNGGIKEQGFRSRVEVTKQTTH